MKCMVEKLKNNNMSRILVLSDVHGSLKALIEVLTKANFDYENDELISLGDLTDGWSQSKEVVEELMKINNLIFIRGNHDQWAIDCLFEKKPNAPYDSWLRHGGQATADSYDGCDEETLKKHHEFLLSSVPYYVYEDENGKKSLFVHGGYDFPSRKDIARYFVSFPIEKQHPDDLMWNRELAYYVNANQLMSTVDSTYEEIYIGHTPLQSFTSNNKFDPKIPQKWSNVWLMDTGCAYNGTLSLMDIKTKELFTSTESMILYPDEMGRNKISYNELLERLKKQ